MAEVAINLKGQDNLTQTVKNAKKAVDDLKYSSTELGKASAQFDKITNSGKSLKTQLRQLQELMADMNLKGLSNTDEFTAIAQKAGEIKDAMADASDAVKRFSSDTQKLDATIQAFQGVAAGVTIATGAMGLFGKENEKVERAILKVQSALAILNGIQQIANLLNKDSALMQQIKAVRLAASTKNTVLNTAATKANSIATRANTASVAANTAAQNAWNTAKAVGKALFGDFTGLVLVGVSALSAYAFMTDNAEYEQKRLNDELDKSPDKMKDYTKTMSDTFSNLMTTYTRLRAEWKTLSDVHEKNKWIDDNRSKFDELELSISSVEDAEKAFGSNTNAVVDGFIKRAKAAATLAQLTDLYRKQMELIDKRGETLEGISQNSMQQRTGVTARAGQQIPRGSAYQSTKYGEVDRNGQWRFTEQGARNWNQGLGENAQSVKKIDEQIQQNNEQITKITGLIEEDVKNRGTFTPNKRTDNETHTPQNTKNGTNEVKFAQGSLDDLENQLGEAKKRLTSGLFQTGETQDSIKRLIEDLQSQVKSKKIELGLELSDEAKAALERQKEQSKKLEDIRKKDAEAGSQKVKLDLETEDLLKTLDHYSDSEKVQNIEYEIKAYEKLKSSLVEIMDMYKEMDDVDFDALDKLWEKYQDIDKKIRGLYEQEAQPWYDTNKFEEQQEGMRQFSEVAKEASGAVSSVGRAFSAMGEESAAAVMEMVSTTLSGVAQAIPAIMELIAAKQGEALAAGNASAAHLPYPANIAAMASITATIISTFASIIAAAQRFAGGGIVGGSSMHGDHLIARVNSGEMILNGSQQKRLFDLLDGGGATGGGIAQVEWKIKGSDLYGSLKNYSNIKSKSGRHIL